MLMLAALVLGGLVAGVLLRDPIVGLIHKVMDKIKGIL